MNQRVILIACAFLCASFIDAARGADVITLRCGQNAVSAGSLPSLPLIVAVRASSC